MSRTSNKPLCYVIPFFTLYVLLQFKAFASGELQIDISAQAETRPLLVVIEDPRSERRRRGMSGPGYRARLAYDNDPVLGRVVERIASDHDLSVLSQWPLKNLAVHCFVIARPSEKVLSKLSADERVLWVQQFNDYELKDTGDMGMPNGSLNRRFVDEISQRGKNVKVAVVDTAVDRKHPDLRDSKLSVRNFAGNIGTPEQELHGTAVVGLIAAMSDDAKGVSGLAHDARVRLLRACWETKEGRGKCNTLTLALALDAAIAYEPDVINLSLSGNEDPLLAKLLAKLLDKGTLVVAAYDEKREQEARFPPPLPGVVYAFGEEQKPAERLAANIISAPRHALSLAPGAGYELFSGHSIAAPQISAMVACLIDRYPRRNRAEIVDTLGMWLAAQSEELPASETSAAISKTSANTFRFSDTRANF